MPKQDNVRRAPAAFRFRSAAHVVRIGREKAIDLQGLLDGLRSAPDNSIFQHTFQALEEHHFIRQGFSNDFAHWTFVACNEVALAERLAAVDLREFTSIAALRERLVSVVDKYLRAHPIVAHRPAFEPFYFCSSDTVVIPTPFAAADLQEFRALLKQVSAHSVHYHFIEARLRIKAMSNDFSVWLANHAGLPEVAERLNRIDIYTLSLDEVRNEIIRVLDGVAPPEKLSSERQAA